MKLGSLFDGIGGFPLAATFHGITPVWASEIEKFPIEITKTPLECERLQGFPDGWTDIPGASDTGRYKALGNSVAVPCVAWIMRRIAESEEA